MIVNLVKGSGVTGAIRYCEGEGRDKATNQPRHLAAGQASRSELLGGLNFGFEVSDARTLDIARRVMEWQAMPENQASPTRKCVNDCLHVSLSWSEGQTPNNAEMIEAAQGVLESMGMAGSRAVIFRHHDTPGHAHCHIVASRIDPVTGKTFPGLDDRAHANAWALKWERDHGERSPAREGMHRLAEAVEQRRAGATSDALMQRGPSFSGKELDHALIYGGLNPEQAAAFKGELLGRPELIGLRETATGPVTRYTTREVIETENAVLRDVRALQERQTFGVSAQRVDTAALRNTLNPEQADALRHCTAANGFAIIAGQAGTGKSRTLNTIREAYEGLNYTVVGLSHTNKVVNAMRDDGFSHANTVASELGHYEGAQRGRLGADRWDNRTVVMVDEAAMLSTRAMGDLVARARTAGAKLILCGDDKQLASIERGGMFTPLKAEHGAAELAIVMRVRDGAQQTAFNRMHAGDFAAALKTFDQRGAVHFHPNQSAALDGLADRYRADCAHDPGKTRFIFAATNDQVRTLNDLARATARDAGRLGADVAVTTAAGEKLFATGDRVQLTGNGRSTASRRNGYTNANVGTVTGLDQTGDGVRMTVELDGKGDQRQSIAFVVGKGRDQFDKIAHGYAGTIYKGQGDTLDQTYLLHAKQWSAASAYVAMTRHRESMSLHVARDVAPDLDRLAIMLARDGTRKAATVYRIDAASLSKLGYQAGSEHLTRNGAERPTRDPVAEYRQAEAARIANRQRAQEQAFRAHDPGRPVPPPAATQEAAIINKQPETSRDKERREEDRYRAELERRYGVTGAAKIAGMFPRDKGGGDRQQPRDRDGRGDDDDSGGRERGGRSR